MNMGQPTKKNGIDFKLFTLATASVLTLAACGGGGGGSSSDSQATTQNGAPVVNAGPDLEADENTDVLIDASVTDQDNTPTISWTQLTGPTGSFDNTATEDPVFTIPEVDQDETITLRLTADDGVNAPVSDDVTISVTNVTDANDGPSPQGINGSAEDRRNDANDNRSTERTFFGAFEARTYDGWGNNLDNLEWGQTFAYLQRLSPVDYTNGYDSLAGDTRPSARVISNEIFAQGANTSFPNSFGTTDMVWQWGQILSHDTALTDATELSADIPVPTGDPNFDPDSTGTQVIAFNRSIFDPDTGTDTSNPRQQENEITSWLDGSVVYGSSVDRVELLREANTPYLATSDGNLLPFANNQVANAAGNAANRAALFLAGDVRANEQIGIVVLHTLLVREHNRLASELEQANPDASADEVFEETRRRVSGMIQKITYTDWLPLIIGADVLPAYAGYDDTINPSIYNEFSVAAFRLGHSMVNRQIWRLDASGNEIADGHLSLFAAFFGASNTIQEENDIDPILRGLSTQPHQAIDAWVITDLRNMLFGQPGNGGLDLVSLNIQRGRDHGVSSYNDVREAMGLARVTSFDEITSNSDRAEALRSTYGSVDDIDLWVGGLMEDEVDGGQLGELFQTIVVKQFTELRDGDRFWYERDLPSDVVDEINATTLADIIRRNTDIGSELQDNVFVTP